MQAETSPADKARQRAIRNRVNAQLSRERKKRQVEDLEEQVRSLSSRNRFLERRVQELEGEKRQYLEQLSLLSPAYLPRSVRPRPIPSSSSSSSSSPSQAPRGVEANFVPQVPPELVSLHPVEEMDEGLHSPSDFLESLSSGESFSSPSQGSQMLDHLSSSPLLEGDLGEALLPLTERISELTESLAEVSSAIFEPLNGNGHPPSPPSSSSPVDLEFSQPPFSPFAEELPNQMEEVIDWIVPLIPEIADQANALVQAPHNLQQQIEQNQGQLVLNQLAQDQFNQQQFNQQFNQQWNLQEHYQDAQPVLFDPEGVFLGQHQFGILNQQTDAQQLSQKKKKMLDIPLNQFLQNSQIDQRFSQPLEQLLKAIQKMEGLNPNKQQTQERGKADGLLQQRSHQTDQLLSLLLPFHSQTAVLLQSTFQVIALFASVVCSPLSTPLRTSSIVSLPSLPVLSF